MLMYMYVFMCACVPVWAHVHFIFMYEGQSSMYKCILFFETEFLTGTQGSLTVQRTPGGSISFVSPFLVLHKYTTIP